MIKSEPSTLKNTIKEMIKPDSLKIVIENIIFDIKQAIPTFKTWPYIDFMFYFDKNEHIYKKLNISDQYIDYENMSFFIDLHEYEFPFFDKELLDLIQIDENKAKIKIQDMLLKLIDENITKIFLNEKALSTEYYRTTLMTKNDIYFPFANLEDLFLSQLIGVDQIPFLAKTYLDKGKYDKYERLMNYLFQNFLNSETENLNVILIKILSESEIARFIVFKIFKQYDLSNQNVYNILKSKNQYDNDVVFNIITEYSNIEHITDKLSVKQLKLYERHDADKLFSMRYLTYLNLFDNDLKISNYFRYINKELFKLDKLHFDYLLNSNSHVNVILGDDITENINPYSMERMLLLYRKGMLNFSLSKKDDSKTKLHIKKIKNHFLDNYDQLMSLDNFSNVFEIFDFFKIFQKFQTRETAVLMQEFITAINNDIN